MNKLEQGKLTQNLSLFSKVIDLCRILHFTLYSDIMFI